MSFTASILFFSMVSRKIKKFEYHIFWNFPFLLLGQFLWSVKITFYNFYEIEKIWKPGISFQNKNLRIESSWNFAPHQLKHRFWIFSCPWPFFSNSHPPNVLTIIIIMFLIFAWHVLLIFTILSCPLGFTIIPSPFKRMIVSAKRIFFAIGKF